MSDLVYQVADQKPAQMVLFDYYNPEDQVHFFFFFLYFSLNTVTSTVKLFRSAIRARNSSYSVPYSYFTRYFTNSFYREDYGNPFSVESFVFVPRCPVADRFVSRLLDIGRGVGLRPDPAHRVFHRSSPSFYGSSSHICYDDFRMIFLSLIIFGESECRVCVFPGRSANSSSIYTSSLSP